MPVYRFEFVDEQVNPPISVDLENSDKAKAEALETTRQTMLDALAEGADPTQWITRVYDEFGYLIATITFADLVSHPHESEAADGVLRSG